jgi:oxaloacetate decarboxylase gamma subunit
MSEKLLAGLQLMVFGMGMVYVFLIIMIFCMKLMSKIIAPIAAKQKAAEDATKAAAKKPAAASADDTALVAAAVAAVAANRR